MKLSNWGLAAALAAGITTTTSAHAEIPAILQRATHRLWAGGSVGSQTPIAVLGVNGTGTAVPTGFGLGALTYGRFSGEFGGHFGRGADGPAMAGSLNLYFPNCGIRSTLGLGCFGMSFVAHFAWDIQPVRGLALFLQPRVGIGPGFHTETSTSTTSFLLDIQSSFDAKLVLNDKFYVGARPIAFNFPLVFRDGVTAGFAVYEFSFFGGGTF